MKLTSLQIWITRIMYVLLIIFSITFLTVIITNRISYEHQAKLHPNKYSKCVVCYEILPHKKMYAMGNGKYVCEECIALYKWADIVSRSEE